MNWSNRGSSSGIWVLVVFRGLREARNFRGVVDDERGREGGAETYPNGGEDKRAGRNN